MPFESFEEKLRQRLDGVEMQPDAAVWPEIEDRIRQRRRPLAFWWFSAAAGVALLVAGLWLFVPRKAQPQPGSAAIAGSTQGVRPATPPATGAFAEQAEPYSVNPKMPDAAATTQRPVGVHATTSQTQPRVPVVQVPPVQVADLLLVTQETARQEIAVIQPVAPITTVELKPSGASLSPSAQPDWASLALPEPKPDFRRFSVSGYAMQESFFAGNSPLALESKSSNLYADQRSAGPSSASSLLWEVQSPASQLSAGLDVGLRITRRLELRTGLGLFQTDSARVNIGLSVQDLNEGNFISNEAVQGLNPPPPSFVIQGFEAPVRLRYLFGGEKWSGDFGLGAQVRVKLDDLSVRSTNLDYEFSPVNNSGGLQSDLGTNPSVIYLSRALWSGMLEAGITRQISGGASLRVGPVMGYQPSNWLEGPAALNPRPWSLGFHAAVRWR